MDRRSFLIGTTAVGALMAAGKGLAFAQESTAPDLTQFPRNETVIVHNRKGSSVTGMVQPLGRGRGQRHLERPAQPDHGHAVVHRSRCGHRRGQRERHLQLARCRPVAVQRRLHGDDREAQGRHLLERRRRVHRGRRGVHRPEAGGNAGTPYNGAFSNQVAEVSAPDKYTVLFKLNKPNSRFHALFCVRWTAAWIMPKHVYEAVDDILSYDANPPVSIGPYTLHSFDPNGTWYIWQKREDWQRTAMGMIAEPKPKYVIYRNNITTDNRLIEIRNGNLDMVHDLTRKAPSRWCSRTRRSRAGSRASPMPTPIRPCPWSSSTCRTRSSRTSACAGPWRSCSMPVPCRWHPTAVRRPCRPSRCPRPARIRATTMPRCRTS